MSEPPPLWEQHSISSLPGAFLPYSFFTFTLLSPFLEPLIPGFTPHYTLTSISLSLEHLPSISALLRPLRPCVNLKFPHLGIPPFHFCSPPTPQAVQLRTPLPIPPPPFLGISSSSHSVLLRLLIPTVTFFILLYLLFPF